MKNIVIAIVVVVVGAASFWGGGYYQEQKIRANPRLLFGQGGPGGGLGGGQSGQGRFGGMRGGGTGGGFQPQGGPDGQHRGAPILSGRLDKIEDDELTMTTRFGSVKIKLDADTEFSRAAKSDAQELEEKEDVFIETEADDEGNLTAKSVVQ